jgi:sialidase-1
MGRGLRLGSIVSLAALAVLAVPSGAGASAVPAQAPVPAHWWQANGNANDTPATGVSPDNGRLVGAGFGPGPSGTEQAFTFAGGGQRVIFNKSGGNRGTGDFTFEFDIKTTVTVQQGVWEKRIACDSNGTPLWGFRTSPTGHLPGSIGFEYGNPPRESGVISTTSISDGAWHQVAVTRSGGTVKLYIDGTLEATTITPAALNVSNKAPMRAGVSTCDGVDGTSGFTGELAEPMIFRSALTQPQIQALARADGLAG